MIFTTEGITLKTCNLNLFVVFIKTLRSIFNNIKYNILVFSCVFFRAYRHTQNVKNDSFFISMRYLG